MARKNLHDASGFWISLSAAPFVVAGIAITIAITEYHPPWKSVWFIVGVAVGVLGCGLALWSLVLYLAHNHAEQHACPDPSAHIIKDEHSPDSAQGSPAAPVVLAVTQAQSQAERVAWLRPLLREIGGDLRQAKAGIRKLQETSSYDGITSEFNPSDAWSQGRQGLASDESLGDLYDSCRDANERIEWIRLSALSWERSYSPQPPKLADLREAALAVEEAQIAVEKQLSELDRQPPVH